MSLPRRLALLEWANRSRSWIVEDDYDSEYRYSGRPLTALQGLDTADRVVYIGTFSKVLFPSLRLGYAVVPQGLVDAFATARYIVDRQSPTLDQIILTDFITEGHFVRHLRRMRSLYASRRAVLVAAIQRDMGDLLEVTSGEAGLHVLALLRAEMDDREISRRAAQRGIEASALSESALTPPARGGLVLGYAAIAEQEIPEAIRRLKDGMVSLKPARR